MLDGLNPWSLGEWVLVPFPSCAAAPLASIRRCLQTAFVFCKVGVGAFVSLAILQSLLADSRVQSALRDPHTRLQPQRGWATQARLEVELFEGTLLSMARVTIEGIAGLANAQPADLLTLGLGIFGSLSGEVGERPFHASPQRLSYVRLPGESLQCRISSPKAQVWLVHLPLAALEQEFVAQGGEHPDLASLRLSLAPVEGYLLASAERLLALASQASASASRPALCLQRSLLSVVASCLQELDASSPIVEARPGTAHVRQALAFLEEHHQEPLTLVAISRACGVSSRTLQAAFALHHGTTPMEALQQLRLQKLRQLLLRGQASVRQGCVLVGLSFSGRMAQAYRRLFAELPSQTLRQAAGPGAVIPMDGLRTHRENHG